MRPSANCTSRKRGWARRGAGAAAVLAAALVVAPASAADPQPAFNDGLLWRVSKSGISDSFVFGTIHIADPRVNSIAKPVEDALAQSRTLAMEIAPEAVADARVFDLEQFRDGRRLEGLIGPAAFAQVRDRLVAQEIPERVVERLKPWAVLVKLTRAPVGSEALSLDQQLLAAARARRMKLAMLEWLEEQIAAFDSVPMESQIALLSHTLAHPEAVEAAVEPTIEAWRRGDLAALARLGDRISRRFPGMGYHYSQLTKHIIHNRTIVMHHRLLLPLREGRVFVAVGALHLQGDKGLLAMLRRDGYRVTRVWVGEARAS